MGSLAPSAPDVATLETARNHLLEEGWAVIPNVLSTIEAASILTQLWAAKEVNDARGDKTHLPHLDPNASNIRIFNLLSHSPIFRQLITHPIAIDMVKSVLGNNILISNFTANIARPGSASMALHSDQSIIVPPPWTSSWAINVIWCLTDVYKDNGATLYIPQSNGYTTRNDIPPNADKLLVPFEAKAGSIILMDGRVWHTSGANITQDQDRALLFGYYTMPFLRQQVNWTAKLSDEIKRECGEELRGWLGLGETANTGKAGDITYNYLSRQFPKEKDERGVVAVGESVG